MKTLNSDTKSDKRGQESQNTWSNVFFCVSADTKKLVTRDIDA